MSRSNSGRWVDANNATGGLGSRLEKCRLIVVKDVLLGSANIGVYFARALAAVAQEEPPDKPAAAEEPQGLAPGAPQFDTETSLSYANVRKR